MALTIGVSTGTTANAGSSLNVTGISTTVAGEVLVALVSSTVNGVAATMSATVSGGGLTWTLVQRSNARAGETAEVWYAIAASTITNQTITATLSGGGGNFLSALHVLSFKGAAASPIGQSASASNPSGTSANPSASVFASYGSYVVAACADYSNARSITVGSGQTMLTDNHETTTGDEMWTWRSTATTPGGSFTMSSTSTATDQWDMVAVEILADPTLKIDTATAGTGAIVSGTSSSFVTPAFSTSGPNELVVVLVSACVDAGSVANQFTGITGAGLSFSLAARSAGLFSETAEIWYAVASSQITSQTLTLAYTGSNASNSSVAVEILTFTGANLSSPIGATNTAFHAQGTSANPSVTLASTTAGSRVVAAGADLTAAETITAGSGQTLLADNHDTTHAVESWTQRSTGTVGTSMTMGATGTGTDGWDFAAAEILASGSGPVVTPPRTVVVVNQAIARAATR